MPVKWNYCGTEESPGRKRQMIFLSIGCVQQIAMMCESAVKVQKSGVIIHYHIK